MEDPCSETVLFIPVNGCNRCFRPLQILVIALTPPRAANQDRPVGGREARCHGHGYSDSETVSHCFLINKFNHIKENIDCQRTTEIIVPIDKFMVYALLQNVNFFFLITFTSFVFRIYAVGDTKSSGRKQDVSFIGIVLGDSFFITKGY